MSKLGDIYSIFPDEGSLSCGIFLTRRIHCFIFMFLFIIALMSRCFADSCEIKNLPALQYVISRGTSMLSGPSVTWSGNSDILLVDRSKILNWKKMKLFQLQNPKSRSPFRLVFSPEGSRFICTDESGISALGSTDTFAAEILRESIDLDNLLWCRKSPAFYYITNKSLLYFDTKKKYSEKISDTLSDYYLSSDEYRLIIKESATSAYFIMNFDRTLKSDLPQESIFVESRGCSPFIKNVSPDFRWIIRDKPNGKGFLISKIDWQNRLASPLYVLDEYRGYRDAAFSPDGSKIALSCKDDSGKSCMVVMKSTGDILVKFSLKKEWIYHYPLWSPDSKWIVWNYIDPARPQEERNRLLLSDARGVSIQFIPCSVSTAGIYWSSRGDQIILREEEHPLKAGGYVVYDLSRKKMNPIFKDAKIRATSVPVWSPDGNYVTVIDYSTFQKRERKPTEVNGAVIDVESVYFREQVFLYKPAEDTIQLLW